jgi:hypothetical protein
VKGEQLPAVNAWFKLIIHVHGYNVYTTTQGHELLLGTGTGLIDGMELVKNFKLEASNHECRKKQ